MLSFSLLCYSFQLVFSVDVAVGSDGEIRGLIRVESQKDPDGFSSMEEVPMTSDTWPDGTWNRADDHCRAKGKKLCDYKKVCPKGRSHDPAIPGGQKKYEMWTPVRNAEDPNNPVEWVQVGTRQKGDLCCLISSDCHGRVKNFQGWGQVKSFNGFIYCCDNDLPGGLQELQLTSQHWNGSWAEAASVCETKGMKLARWADLCPKGSGKTSSVPQLGKDMWTPVVNTGDQNNSIHWVQVGLRLEGDICKLISDVPGHSESFRGWGELRPYIEYIYCRSNNSLAEDPKSWSLKTSVWLHWIPLTILAMH